MYAVKALYTLGLYCSNCTLSFIVVCVSAATLHLQQYVAFCVLRNW